MTTLSDLLAAGSSDESHPLVGTSLKKKGGGGGVVGTLTHDIGLGLKLLSLPLAASKRVFLPGFTEGLQGIDQLYARTSLPGSGNSRHNIRLRNEAGVHGARWSEVINPQKIDGKRISIFSDPSITDNTQGNSRWQSTLGGALNIGLNVGMDVGLDPLTYLGGGWTLPKEGMAALKGMREAGELKGAAGVAARLGFGPGSRASATEVAAELATHGTDEALQGAMSLGRLRAAAATDTKVARALEDAGLMPRRALTIGHPFSRDALAIPGTERIATAMDSLWSRVAIRNPVSAGLRDILDDKSVRTAGLRGAAAPKGAMLRNAAKTGDVNEFRTALRANAGRSLFNQTVEATGGAVNRNIVDGVLERLGRSTGDVATNDRIYRDTINEAQLAMRRSSKDRGAAMIAHLFEGGAPRNQTEEVMGALVGTAKEQVDRLFDEMAMRMLGPSVPRGSAEAKKLMEEYKTSWEGLKENLVGELATKKGSLSQWATKSLVGGHGGPDAVKVMLSHLDNVIRLHAGVEVLDTMKGSMTPGILNDSAMSSLLKAIGYESRQTRDALLVTEHQKQWLNSPEWLQARVAEGQAARAGAVVDTGVRNAPTFAVHPDLSNAAAHMAEGTLAPEHLNGLDDLAAKTSEELARAGVLPTPATGRPLAQELEMRQNRVAMIRQNLEGAQQRYVPRLRAELAEAESRLAEIRASMTTAPEGVSGAAAAGAVTPPVATHPASAALDAIEAQMQARMAAMRSAPPETMAAIADAEERVGIVRQHLNDLGRYDAETQARYGPPMRERLVKEEAELARARAQVPGTTGLHTNPPAPTAVLDKTLPRGVFDPYEVAARQAMVKNGVDPLTAGAVEKSEARLAAMRQRLEETVKQHKSGAEVRASIVEEEAKLAQARLAEPATVRPSITPTVTDHQAQVLDAQGRIDQIRSSMEELITKPGSEGDLPVYQEWLAEAEADLARLQAAPPTARQLAAEAKPGTVPTAPAGPGSVPLVTGGPTIPFIDPKTPAFQAEKATNAHFGAVARNLDDIYTGTQKRFVEGIAELKDALAYRLANGGEQSPETFAHYARMEAEALEKIVHGANAQRLAALAGVEQVAEALKGNFRNTVFDIAGEHVNIKGGPDAVRALFDVGQVWKHDPYMGADADELFGAVYQALADGNMQRVGRTGNVSEEVFSHVARTLPGQRMSIENQLSHANWITDFWRSNAIARPGFSNRNFWGGLMNNLGMGVSRKTTKEATEEAQTYLRYRKAVRTGEGMTPELESAYNRLAKVENGDRIRLLDGWAQMRGQGLTHTPGEPSSLIRMGNKMQDFWQNLGEHRNPFDIRALYVGPTAARDVPVEVTLRYSLYKHLRDVEGLSQSSALSKVDHIHFDYTDMSPFDQKMKQFVPFWTYRSRNLALQAEMIARGLGPGRVLLRARQSALEQNARQGGGILPDYLTGTALPISGGHVLNLNAFPTSDFIQGLNSIYSTLQGKHEGMEELLSNVGPLPKLAYIGIARKDPLTGREPVKGQGMDLRELGGRSLIPNLDLVPGLGTRYGKGDRKMAGQRAGEKAGGPISFGGIALAGVGIGAAEVAGVTPFNHRWYNLKAQKQKPKYSGG